MLSLPNQLHLAELLKRQLRSPCREGDVG